MSAMFSVEVIDTDNQKGIAKLFLTIINPDQKSFPDSKSFAVMLLLDSIREFDITTAPILKQIPMKDIEEFNFEIIKRKQNKIIKKIEISDYKNWPLPKEMESCTEIELKKFWSNTITLPSAIATISTVKNDFASHLVKGQHWESGAFSIN